MGDGKEGIWGGAGEKGGGENDKILFQSKIYVIEKNK